jgi:hypothetical protein
MLPFDFQLNRTFLSPIFLTSVSWRAFDTKYHVEVKIQSKASKMWTGTAHTMITSYQTLCGQFRAFTQITSSHSDPPWEAEFYNLHFHSWKTKVLTNQVTSPRLQGQ